MQYDRLAMRVTTNYHHSTEGEDGDAYHSCRESGHTYTDVRYGRKGSVGKRNLEGIFLNASPEKSGGKCM